MTKPKRPETVPADAVWDELHSQWKHGPGRTAQHGFPTGTWRYWREDGTLACVAEYNDEGLNHGAVERFHQDGTLASRDEWRDGYRKGVFTRIRSKNPTTETYPEDERTWRFEYELISEWKEANHRWYLEDGTQCTSRGVPILQAHDLNGIVAACNPADFTTTGAALVNALSTPTTSAHYKEIIEALWGCRPVEVMQLRECLPSSLDFSPAVELRSFDSETNVWRSLIEHPWRNQFEELGAVLMGAVLIGSVGDSNGVYATLFRPDGNAVYHWDHDTYHIDEVMALSFGEFAFRVGVSAACEQERLSHANAREAWRKLAGRIQVDWYIKNGLDSLYSEVGDDPDDFMRKSFHTDLDPLNEIRGPFWRGQWILCLLVPDAERNWDNVQETFRDNWNSPLTEDEHIDYIALGHREPHTAIYLLWRYFWFDDRAHFEACCNAYRTHRGRLIRDLISLLNEIISGKTTLAGIADVFAVRTQFLKMLSTVWQKKIDRSIDTTRVILVSINRNFRLIDTREGVLVSTNLEIFVCFFHSGKTALTNADCTKYVPC